MRSPERRVLSSVFLGVSLLAVLLVVVSLESPVTWAQGNSGAVPSRGPGWLPRRTLLPAAQYKVTPAELATVISRLTEIERLVTQVEEMARPVGFEIEPIFGGFTQHESVLSYGYEAMVYSPSKKEAGEGTVCFTAEINALPSANQTGYHDDEAEILIEHEQGDPFAGATHTWKTLSPTETGVVYAMFTSGKVSPLEPVTRERYLKAIIQTDTEHEAQARKATAQSTYQVWMAGVAERKAARDGIRAALPPAQAAALIKAMEDDERKVTAELKATEASAGAESAKAVAVYTQSVARARTELAAMTPAERTAPGWVERRGDFREKLALGSVGFAPPTTPFAGRLVVARNDLLKGRTSHIDPRLIHVKISALLSCGRPVVQRAVYQLYKKLDWAALARMVN